jgi:hypothetical protein
MKIALAACVVAIALAGCSSTRTVTHTVHVPGPVVTRTVTAPPKVVIRYRTSTPVQTQPSPGLTSAFPPGVTRIAEITPGTPRYLVDCFVAQCTSSPGAGPFGTTCGEISTGAQECQ